MGLSAVGLNGVAPYIATRRIREIEMRRLRC
jgi:hypothetical protein